MGFLDWLIKEYRPRLMQGRSLEPLPAEMALKLIEDRKNAKDAVFLTQQEGEGGPSRAQQQAQREPTGGDLVDAANFDNAGEQGKQGASLQDSIPVSHTDVHRFIAETCEENLFLINLNNKEQERKAKMSSSNNEEIEKLTKQILQTKDTIKVLSERKEFLLTKIQIKEQGLAQNKAAEGQAAQSGKGQPQHGRQALAGSKTEQKAVELAEDPLYAQLIERVLDMYALLFDSRTLGGRQSAVSAAVLQSFGLMATE